MKETPDVLEVVAAVISDEGRYLACRRSPGRSAGGLWEFPGGKIESGETPEAALVREIREELGVAVRIDSHLTTDETVVGTRTIRLACFMCTLEGEQPVGSSDHDQLIWLDAATLTRLEWASPDIPAVHHLARQAGGDSI
jgi:8-oxo-dGTP diphosphatase